MKKGNENVRGIIPITDYNRLETTGECGIFQLCGWHDDKLCKMDT